MSTQIFKTKIPSKLLYELMDKICLKTDKYYLFNTLSFKKGLAQNNAIAEFFENIKPYYHVSKQKYVEGEITYKKMTTVIRQLCNFNKIVYTSKIIYDKSSYDIHYLIYLNE